MTIENDDPTLHQEYTKAIVRAHMAISNNQVFCTVPFLKKADELYESFLTVYAKNGVTPRKLREDGMARDVAHQALEVLTLHARGDKPFDVYAKNHEIGRYDKTTLATDKHASELRTKVAVALEKMLFLDKVDRRAATAACDMNNPWFRQEYEHFKTQHRRNVDMTDADNAKRDEEVQSIAHGMRNFFVESHSGLYEDEEQQDFFHTGK